MSRYRVEWQLGGEAIFVVPDTEEQVREEISQALDGIATDANDNMVEGFQVSHLVNPMQGVAEFTLTKLDDREVSDDGA